MLKKKMILALTICVAASFAVSRTTYAQITDTVRFQAKNTGFGITDIDKDGFSEILMFDDNTGFVRVFESSAANTYALVKEWQPNPANWVPGATVKSQIPQADFDQDGVLELYLSDTKGNSWIISPGGDVAAMFDDANWTRLHDWKVGLTFGTDYNEGGEVRGGLIGDVDADGKPDIYLAGNNYGAILDIEWDGGAGDVTDGDNYSYFTTHIDGADVTGGRFARPRNIQITDMDGDGLKEITAIIPWTGDFPVDNLLGIYVFEQDAASVGDNNALTNVWHEASDAIFARGYVLTGGGSLKAEIDIDQDGLGEFLTYEQDGGQHIVYLFEVTSATSNTWQIVWQYQFSDGTTGLAGNQRGIMVTDIDGDGNQEIVVIIDSDDPANTDGFDAGHIWEWDGAGTSLADNNGLPSTPTATFDPPRDAIGHVSLENNSLVFDVDNDGMDELVLTHRGGNGLFLSIISLEATDTELAAGNVTVVVEFEDKFFVPEQVINNPFVLNPIMEVVVDEDFGSIIVALLDTVFDDLDLPNDSLRYTVSFSSGIVSGNITGNTLQLFSIADSSGMTKVLVTATDDSSASVSDTFNVIIVPIGDSPSIFSLTSPLGDTLNTLLPPFRWHPAIDPDFGDLPVYLIRISASESLQLPIYLGTFIDTSYTLAVPLADDSLYFWSVTAIDSSGNFAFSDTSSFLLDKRESPEVFSLIGPVDGSGIDSLRPVFNWELSIDPDPRDVVKYTLIILSGPDTVYMFAGIEDSTHQVSEDILVGSYQWFVVAEDFDDESLDRQSSEIFNLSVIVGIDDEIAGIPNEYNLYQNYPNPFNPVTVLRYALPKSSNVTLVIYNLMGQEVMRWDESFVSPGYYEKTWNGTTQAGVPVSSGIYIYHIVAGDFVKTRKMVFLK